MTSPSSARGPAASQIAPPTAAAPAEVEAAPDVDDDRMLHGARRTWAASAPEVVVFDEIEVTDQANKMSEDALREALVHASRDNRGEKAALVARFVDLQRRWPHGRRCP